MGIFQEVLAGLSTLEVATPILVHRDDGHKHGKRSHGDVVFLTSRGEVTSYSPGLHGEGAIWRWQLTTGATWSNPPAPSGMMEDEVVPTLKAFRLRVHDHQEVVIAGGDQEAVVISPGGSLLATIELPWTHSLVLEDFSGDGLTDVILVTSGGVYGFVQTRQPCWVPDSCHGSPVRFPVFEFQWEKQTKGFYGTPMRRQRYTVAVNVLQVYGNSSNM